MTSDAARLPFDRSTGMSAMVHRAAIVALLARRAIWLSALSRSAPLTPAARALSADEIALLDRLARSENVTTTLDVALEKLARIGGGSSAARRLARPFAVARGLSRIADIQIAQRLRAAKYIDRS